MGRYPAEPLESKLAWMREKQQRNQAAKAKVAERRLAVLPPREASSQLPQMLRVKEVAEALGVSGPTVRIWFARRAVVVKSPHSKRKSVMLIPQRAFDEWIREHTASSR